MNTDLPELLAVRNQMETITKNIEAVAQWYDSEITSIGSFVKLNPEKEAEILDICALMYHCAWESRKLLTTHNILKSELEEWIKQR